MFNLRRVSKNFYTCTNVPYMCPTFGSNPVYMRLPEEFNGQIKLQRSR
jgi:hypothetical protein